VFGQFEIELTRVHSVSRVLQVLKCGVLLC
jgi:hypothetical protein